MNRTEALFFALDAIDRWADERTPTNRWAMMDALLAWKCHV